MQAQVLSYPTNISQVAEHIFSTRRITRHDQSLLMSLLSHQSLGESEQHLINKIYEMLHKGFIRVID